MKTLTLIIISILFSTLFNTATNAQERIKSSIVEMESNEIVLRHEFTVQATLAEVWTAYTTSEGWEAWAVEHASVDLRTNGRILTNYNPEGEIGDDETLEIKIINYVPYRLLTLQSVIPDNFPDFMKENEAGFYNIIEFTELESKLTKVISYGLGYDDTPEYRNILAFFSEANVQAFTSLIDYLESE